MMATAAKRRRRRPPQRDGVVVREQVGTLGGSFLRALGGAWPVEPKRAARGRADARAGRVHMFAFDGTAFRARVTGKREHRVSLGLALFDDEAWARAESALARSPAALAALRAGQMSSVVDAACSVAGAPLLPRAPGDVRAACTCTDDARPCRHLLALALVAAHALDRDPALLLRLRGRTLATLAAALERQGATTTGVTARPTPSVAPVAPPVASAAPAARPLAPPMTRSLAPPVVPIMSSSTVPASSNASSSLAAPSRAIAPLDTATSRSSTASSGAAPTPAITAPSSSSTASSSTASSSTASSSDAPQPMRIRVRVSPARPPEQAPAPLPAPAPKAKASSGRASSARRAPDDQRARAHAATTVPAPATAPSTMPATRMAFEQFDRAPAPLPPRAARVDDAGVAAPRLASSTWPDEEALVAVLAPLYARASEYARTLLKSGAP